MCALRTHSLATFQAHIVRCMQYCCRVTHTVHILQHNHIIISQLSISRCCLVAYSFSVSVARKKSRLHISRIKIPLCHCQHKFTNSNGKIQNVGTIEDKSKTEIKTICAHASMHNPCMYIIIYIHISMTKM